MSTKGITIKDAMPGQPRVVLQICYSDDQIRKMFNDDEPKMVIALLNRAQAAERKCDLMQAKLDAVRQIMEADQQEDGETPAGETPAGEAPDDQQQGGERDPYNDPRQWVCQHDLARWHWYPNGHSRPAACGHAPIPGMPLVSEEMPASVACVWCCAAPAVTGRSPIPRERSTGGDSR